MSVNPPVVWNCSGCDYQNSGPICTHCGASPPGLAPIASFDPENDFHITGMQLANASLMSIRDAGEEVMSFHPDGTVWVNPKFEATEVARVFWKVIRDTTPSCIPFDALLADIDRACRAQFSDRGEVIVQALEQKRHQILKVIEELLGCFYIGRIRHSPSLSHEGSITPDRWQELRKQLQEWKEGR